MAGSLKIEFKIFIGKTESKWVNIRQLLGESPFVVDYYINIKNLNCCCFQGGYFIDIDGSPWSDDGTVDEFWMTESWLSALNSIFDGQSTAGAAPWEESNLSMKREGDVLELVDISHGGRITMSKVAVPLFAFTEQMLRESKLFCTWVDEIRDEINTRRASGVAEEVEVKFKEIEKQLPGEAFRRDIETLVGKLGNSDAR